MENQEMPIGFVMELAQHLDALHTFSNLSETEQQKCVDGARQVKSREEMRAYVENMF